MKDTVEGPTDKLAGDVSGRSAHTNKTRESQ